MKRKTKNTLKTILLSALGIGAIVGGVSLINNMVGNDEDLKTIHPIFEVGGLDEATGKYVDDDGTIYTKEAFECLGLEIKLDFDNTIDYQVFFYETDGDFVSSSEVMSGNQDLEVPIKASHARIEITPQWDEMGEDYKKDEDQVIKWYEVSKYSSQMEIKVDKVQEWEEKNFYEADSTMFGKYYNIDNTNGTYEITESSNFYSSKWFNVSENQTYLIGVEDNFVGNQSVMFCYKLADGTYKQTGQVEFNCTNSGEILWLEYTTCENAVSCSIMANNASGTYQDFIIHLK